MALQTLWFALIALLWVGYFFLEGFDFGVGMLLPVLARDDIDRRVLIHTIGPVWDGNEVWLLVAGGATFAAFPNWYAALFSGFYLALFLVLVALIVRGVAFEYRGKRDSPRWRAGWDRAIVVGSAVPALLWGVAFADIIHGVPIDAHQEYAGTFLDLLSPYGLYGGVTTLVLFALHGANFLTLKTTGEMLERARRAAARLAWPAAALLVGFLIWTYANTRWGTDTGVVPGEIPVTALALILLVPFLVSARRHGWAFAAAGGAVALTVATLFLNLYPRVLVSSIDARYSLTISNSSSTQYTLTVMTVVALVFTPVVLLYQGWTYWVFRQRVSREGFELPRILQRRGGPGSGGLFGGDAPAPPAGGAPGGPPG